MNLDEKSKMFEEFKKALATTLHYWFGGEIAKYVIEYDKRDWSLKIKYVDSNCEIEFAEKKAHAVFLCKDDLELTILRVTKDSELKKFMTFEERTFTDHFIYKLSANIVDKIVGEAFHLKHYYLIPLKEKIVKTVCEEYVRNFKLAEEFGRKE
jgi:hypothetical protein